MYFINERRRNSRGSRARKFVKMHIWLLPTFAEPYKISRTLNLKNILHVLLQTLEDYIRKTNHYTYVIVILDQYPLNLQSPVPTSSHCINQIQFLRPPVQWCKSKQPWINFEFDLTKLRGEKFKFEIWFPSTVQKNQNKKWVLILGVNILKLREREI